VQLAERLKIRQSDVSKIERGVRRLDVVELHGWLRALGMPIYQFATVLDERLVAMSALEEAWEPGTVMGTPIGRHRGERS
jgi:transcriptional regulator with XRE-family HTH domain